MHARAYVRACLVIRPLFVFMKREKNKLSYLSYDNTFFHFGGWRAGGGCFVCLSSPTSSYRMVKSGWGMERSVYSLRDVTKSFYFNKTIPLILH